MLRLLATVLICFCSAGTVLGQASAKPDLTIVLTGRREASEASWSTKSTRYIPFAVPAGATKVIVKQSCDWGPDKTERHTMDTGLFDPRGYGFGGPGFRGWQGGSGADIVIGTDRATTDRYYVPGPIYPGTWNIVQRFLRSTKAGLNYTYTVTISFEQQKPGATVAAPGVDQGVIQPTSGWYPGDMHLHTIHSDGNKTLVQSIEQHESQGYRFMVSTDHNTPTAHYDFAEAAALHPKTLLICGAEWTTGGGHANAVGMRPGSWLDFRIDSGDGKLPSIIDSAHAMDAMFVINHPFSIKWRYPDQEWEKADAIEVWNGGFGADDGEAVALWESKIKTGRHMTAVAGTDSHGGVGRTATFVYASNLSQAAILDGLKKEHVFVSESPKGPMLILSSASALPGDTVTMDNDGTVPVQLQVFSGKGKTLRLIWSSSNEKIEVTSDFFKIDRKIKMDVNQKQCFVRAELLKPDGSMSALTNAIYVQR